MFAELESRFGPHSIDRFASALNTLLPRYKAAWLDPTCEAVDSSHLPDADWRRESNWCNAPRPLLPDLMHKLQQSGAAATVVAPRWEARRGTKHSPRWQWRSSQWLHVPVCSGRGGGTGEV
eukprot:jgi/Tetstr1/438704/TSEL_027253.t1